MLCMIGFTSGGRVTAKGPRTQIPVHRIPDLNIFWCTQQYPFHSTTTNSKSLDPGTTNFIELPGGSNRPPEIHDRSVSTGNA